MGRKTEEQKNGFTNLSLTEIGHVCLRHPFVFSTWFRVLSLPFKVSFAVRHSFVEQRKKKEKMLPQKGMGTIKTLRFGISDTNIPLFCNNPLISHIFFIFDIFKHQKWMAVFNILLEDSCLAVFVCKKKWLAVLKTIYVSHFIECVHFA